MKCFWYELVPGTYDLEIYWTLRFKEVGTGDVNLGAISIEIEFEAMDLDVII